GIRTPRPRWWPHGGQAPCRAAAAAMRYPHVTPMPPSAGRHIGHGASVATPAAHVPATHFRFAPAHVSVKGQPGWHGGPEAHVPVVVSQNEGATPVTQSRVVCNQSTHDVECVASAHVGADVRIAHVTVSAVMHCASLPSGALQHIVATGVSVPPEGRKTGGQ